MWPGAMTDAGIRGFAVRASSKVRLEGTKDMTKDAMHGHKRVRPKQ
jgi:hypothetical protein